MIRNASAVWRGGLKDGNGVVSTATGVLKDTPYTFSTRFENAPGTNPEELVAAAHAACFAMAFSGKLGGAGMTAETIDTKATLTLEKLDVGWTVTAIHLDVVSKILNADLAAYLAAAEDARATCPISRLLNAKITVTATLA